MKRFCLIAVLMILGAAAFAEDMNVTKSPDGTMEAFTRDNDLWVRNIASGAETRLTFDGDELTLNGYASWVYYEEILGRPSKYKAFWWSPDSRKIGFYRFDNSGVNMFPIFSPFGQNGSLSLTRYPKSGSDNPEVRVGIILLGNGAPETVWADFEYGDQYFGIPFWSADSRDFYVAREPRRQNQLGLYRVNAISGQKQLIYTEHHSTWVDWIEGMIFGKNGLYMVRDFETGWQQIYYLSYDGKELKRLTDGQNWDMSLLKVDEKKGDIWFMAKRDSRVHPSVYRLDKAGKVHCLSDPSLSASAPKFSDNGKTIDITMSTAARAPKVMRCDAYNDFSLSAVLLSDQSFGKDMSNTPTPQLVKIQNDGFDLYGLISYPKGFDASAVGKYPVLMEVYGGPGTAYVRDRWGDRDASNQWCFENGIIYMVVDPRSSGENGRKGMDQAFRQMTVIELDDYIAWAKYMQGFKYVRADRIGVDGFSFGGTTTAMLVLRYPEYFSCGIAGGGVYDWMLYDTHYTERFMDTPEANPDGYARASVMTFVPDRVSPAYKPGSLRLTHGTGDDNVHFQNTLQLIDDLQKAGVQFELMIYPDGMHGYRDKQHEHDMVAAQDFWRRKLLAE